MIARGVKVGVSQTRLRRGWSTTRGNRGSGNGCRGSTGVGSWASLYLVLLLASEETSEAFLDLGDRVRCYKRWIISKYAGETLGATVAGLKVWHWSKL